MSASRKIIKWFFRGYVEFVQKGQNICSEKGGNCI